MAGDPRYRAFLRKTNLPEPSAGRGSQPIVNSTAATYSSMQAEGEYS
jgi:hypothetical protein